MNHQKLQISEDLSLPANAITQAIAWMGRRGSGKSYGATRLAELFHGIGAQFIAIDPVGIWYGLRLGYNGSGIGIDVPIFGGLHGDIPLESSSGNMMADVLVDRHSSAVLDVSQFEAETDKARFAADFAARFFHRKKSEPSPVHIFIEESQEFIPQNIQRGEERMLHVWQRMIRLGRNFGIGVSMIGQRPQDINKKALNQTECLFCFQLTGPHERKAVEEWADEKGLDDDLSAILPKLHVGHAHVWSPAWLEVNKEVLISKKETFPAGRTPQLGETPKTAKPLAPIELEKIKQDMAETVEKAKASDPKLLQQRVRELERQLASRPTSEKENIVEKIIEVPVLKNGQLDRTEKVADRVETIVGKLSGELQELRKLIAPASAPRPVPVVKITPLVRQSPPRRETSVVVDGLTRPEQRILNAIGWLESIGVAEPERAAVAFLAGYTYGSGGFNNPMGSLRTKELVEYMQDNKIRLTSSGAKSAVIPEQPLSLSELHGKVMSVLPNPEQRILKPLLEAYPNPMSNEGLSAAAGYANNSGGYNSPRGRLRTLGLIDYRGGQVVARDILFPDGALQSV